MFIVSGLGFGTEFWSLLFKVLWFRVQGLGLSWVYGSGLGFWVIVSVGRVQVLGVWV